MELGPDPAFARRYRPPAQFFVRAWPVPACSASRCLASAASRSSVCNRPALYPISCKSLSATLSRPFQPAHAFELNLSQAFRQPLLYNGQNACQFGQVFRIILERSQRYLGIACFIECGDRLFDSADQWPACYNVIEFVRRR